MLANSIDPDEEISQWCGISSGSSLFAKTPIPARSHAFVEIDHKIISTTILIPSADSRRVVRYKRKYVHEVPG